MVDITARIISKEMNGFVDIFFGEFQSCIFYYKLLSKYVKYFKNKQIKHFSINCVLFYVKILGLLHIFDYLKRL